MYAVRNESAGRVFKLIDFALTQFTPDDGRDSAYDFERGGAQSYSKCPKRHRCTEILTSTLR